MYEVIILKHATDLAILGGQRSVKPADIILDEPTFGVADNMVRAHTLMLLNIATKDQLAIYLFIKSRFAMLNCALSSGYAVLRQGGRKQGMRACICRNSTRQLLALIDV